jgi:hypothetical protein
LTRKQKEICLPALFRETVEHETIGSALSAYAAQLDRQADEAGIILHEEPKPRRKRIVQLGAGFGGLEGLAEARKLMEQMDSADKPEIVVIVSFFFFFYPPTPSRERPGLADCSSAIFVTCSFPIGAQYCSHHGPCKPIRHDGP